MAYLEGADRIALSRLFLWKEETHTTLNGFRILRFRVIYVDCGRADQCFSSPSPPLINACRLSHQHSAAASTTTTTLVLMTCPINISGYVVYALIAPPTLVVVLVFSPHLSASVTGFMVASCLSFFSSLCFPFWFSSNRLVFRSDRLHEIWYASFFCFV